MNHQPVEATTAQSFLPKVSVVIPIYNGEADLPDLLSCLLLQTYPKDQVEYLLVDNNSSDRTLPILQTTAENSPITIRLLSENKIQSSYAARNTGIKAATGEIIAFTDADCRPQPQWLNKLIRPFINSAVVIVAGEIVALPGKSLLEQFADKQETLSQKHTLAHKFCPYGQTANLAIRRQVFTKSGLFRPYLTTGGDADICWRILKANLGKLEFAADAIVQHRHRLTIKELASQWRRYGRSNRYLHELHHIELTREMKTKEYGYILLRWLLKEVPRESIKNIIGKAGFVDFLNTPLGLFTGRERSIGQREAKLPENAHIIEWL
ncbi:glycosyltransferase [Anabaena sphaerica FACHB-251]|uniref:Glycosyltransferase n=1 Tax=Anabaena sphaerica FACHB-251 TaxID=2692883 RepID=A0A927A1W9_9NOST|nr:glycosyltransferase [Anabaena sphaerica]MBD2293930.1 glycosyltransferase [Anabaena sphaerica FACHB-251]